MLAERGRDEHGLTTFSGTTILDHHDLPDDGGLYIVIARGNMVKKLSGSAIFQTSVYLLYIAPGKIIGGTAPIIDPAFTVYSNPLPHVLILTAIVVGVATLALGLALVVRIHEAYGTIEEDEILARGRAGVNAGAVAAHLPALQVVLPLIGRLLAAIRSPRRDRVGDRGRDLADACHRRRSALAGARRREGRSRMHLGGWPPPWGIEYRVDALNAFVLLLVSRSRGDDALRAAQHRLRDRWRQAGLVLYACTCSASPGCSASRSPATPSTLFVFLEISSLSTYVLIALGPDRRRCSRPTST